MGICRESRRIHSTLRPASGCEVIHRPCDCSAVGSFRHAEQRFPFALLPLDRIALALLQRGKRFRKRDAFIVNEVGKVGRALAQMRGLASMELVRACSCLTCSNALSKGMRSWRTSSARAREWARISRSS